MKRPAVNSELPPTRDTASSITPEELEYLARCFNTALISTRAESQMRLTDELHLLLQSPAYRQILDATRRLATSQNVTETTAAEQLIAAFRKVDQIWSEYVFMEGVARLREPGPPPE
jgi:tRNA nucleotidyltransferase/poly(A) polymerase